MTILDPDRNPRGFFILKLASIAFISGALGLELGNFWANAAFGAPIIDKAPLTYIGRSALIIHGIEGAIAAVIASSKQRPPLSYGIYTFFVGAMGLAELSKE